MEREMLMQSLHEPLIRRWQLSITCVDYGLTGASDLQRIRTSVVDADSSPDDIRMKVIGLPLLCGKTHLFIHQCV